MPTDLLPAPSKPRTLTTSSEALNTITATWREPEYSNGVLGQYNISWYRDNETAGHTLVMDAMYSIVGLLPCVEYRVRVAATTGVGEGEYEEGKQTTGKGEILCFPTQNSKN